MESARRFGCLLALLMIGGSALSPSQAFGWQATETAETPVSNVSEAAADEKDVRSTVPKTEAKQSFVLILEDGRTLEVPAGATIEKFFEWLQDQKQKPADALPEYFVNTVAIDGSVDRERTAAQLDVAIEIVVLKKDGVVTVPLRLDEGTPLGVVYDRDDSIAFLPSERRNSVTVRIAGEGRRQIRLKLSVPLRRKSNPSRLVLSLPASFQSSLSLSISGGDVELRKQDFDDARVTASADGISIVEAHGLGTTLDISWQQVASEKSNRPVLNVATVMGAAVTTDGVQIDANQRVTASRGVFSALNVRIPSGFEVRSLESTSHPDIEWGEPQFQRVPIALGSATDGPVDLIWTLVSTTPVGDELILQNAFEIEEATRQEAYLGLGMAEGLRPSLDEERSRGLQQYRLAAFQERAEEMQLDSTGEPQYAWKILSSSFRGVFRLDRIVPGYSVAPEYELVLHESIAELKAVFKVRIFRGSVDSIPLHWPGFVQQNWRAEDVGEETSVEITPPSDAAAEPIVGLRLSEEKFRTDELWLIELSCRRPMTSDGTVFDLSLPVPLVPEESLKTPRVRIRNADNIESTIDLTAETSARLVPLETVFGPDTPENKRDRLWEIDSSRIAFNASAEVREQTVTTDSRATLKLHDDRITVEQEINYSVAYERLKQVRLEVPQELLQSVEVRFFLKRPGSDERQEVFQSQPGLEERIPIQLPVLWGRFTLLCEYSIPIVERLTPGESRTVSVPLIQSSEPVPEVTRVVVDSPGNVDVRVDDADWRPELSIGRFPMWLSSSVQRYLPVSLQPAPRRASESFTVKRSVLQSRLRDGVVETSGSYLIEGDISYLSVRLPLGSDLESLQVSWDGQVVPEDRISVPPEGRGELRIDTTVFQQRTHHVLVLNYREMGSRKFSHLNRVPLRAPAFAADVWLSETIWEITLPYQQHLFVYPDNWSPYFHWSRQGVVWRRRSLEPDLKLDHWLVREWSDDENAVPPSASMDRFSDTVSGNSYRFTAYGHQSELSMQTMSLPAIVLVGSGLAVAIGFVLLRIPATRHLLTFLFVGFAMSLAGLWHLEAVQLLLQPAVFGLILAAAAAMIEERIKNRQSASFVTFSSPGDLLATGSSREEIIKGDFPQPEPESSQRVAGQ